MVFFYINKRHLIKFVVAKNLDVLKVLTYGREQDGRFLIRV